MFSDRDNQVSTARLVARTCYDAFRRRGDDYSAVREELDTLWLWPKMTGPSRDGTSDVTTCWLPGTETLSVSMRSLSDGRWHADVVLIISPSAYWIEYGCLGLREWSLHGGDCVHPNSVVIVGDDDEDHVLADRLRSLGMKATATSTPEDHLDDLMRGSALVSLRELRGSQPAVHLTIRESADTMRIISRPPVTTSEFTDHRAESDRAPRSPFVAWLSNEQYDAIIAALEVGLP